MAESTLVRKPPTTDDELLGATELRQRLRAEATSVATMVEDWATRAEPVSFKDFEKALRDLVFGFARIAIMLFLALREEHVMCAYPRAVELEGRRFRRAPAIARSLATLFGVVRYVRTAKFQRLVQLV